MNRREYSRCQREESSLINSIYFCPICGQRNMIDNETSELYYQEIDVEDEIQYQECACGGDKFLCSHIAPDDFLALSEAAFDMSEGEYESLDECIETLEYAPHLQEALAQYYPKHKENTAEAWFFNEFVLPEGHVDFKNPETLFNLKEDGLMTEQQYYARGGSIVDKKIKAELEEAEQWRKQRNAMQAELNRKPKCPICGSENLTKITNVRKGLKAFVWGIWAIGEMDKTWECNHCGSKF